MRSFEVFNSPNKRLNKRSGCRCFETLWSSCYTTVLARRICWLNSHRAFVIMIPSLVKSPSSQLTAFASGNACQTVIHHINGMARTSSSLWFDWLCMKANQYPCKAHAKPWSDVKKYNWYSSFEYVGRISQWFSARLQYLHCSRSRYCSLTLSHRYFCVI